MKPLFLGVGMMVVLLGTAQAGTYRWVDKSGNVHYGDEPSTEATQVEQKRFGDVSDAENAGLPYETRLALQKFPVTLYVTQNCADPCRQARDFLNRRGIPFSEKSLLTQKEIDDFRQLSGSDESPTLSIGKSWLKGFEAGPWNSELDLAGYPKVAPYRPATPAKTSSDQPVER